MMNERQEKDIIRTLVKAGHVPLAKEFAKSRGYRVKGAPRRVTPTTAALDDHDKRGEWNIHVYKSRPTRWDFFVKNPQGGGGGSSSYKSAQAALTVALRNTDFKGAKRVWVVIAKWNAEAGDYDVTKSYWHTLSSVARRVKAAKVIDAVEVFWDTDSDPSNPGWVMDVMPLGNIPFAPKYYHLKKSASDRELYKAVHETLKNEGMKAGPNIQIEIAR